MTVAELIEKLQEMPQDWPVGFSDIEQGFDVVSRLRPGVVNASNYPDSGRTVVPVIELEPGW